MKKVQNRDDDIRLHYCKIVIKASIDQSVLRKVIKNNNLGKKQEQKIWKANYFILANTVSKHQQLGLALYIERNH